MHRLAAVLIALSALLAACGDDPLVDATDRTTATIAPLAGGLESTTIATTASTAPETTVTTLATTEDTPPPTPAPTEPPPTEPPAAAVSYKNCDAVREAGAAPIHKGDPGYSSELDRDGDGVACE